MSESVRLIVLIIFIIVATAALVFLSLIGREIAVKSIEVQKEVAIRCCEATATTTVGGGAVGQGSEDAETPGAQEDEAAANGESPGAEPEPEGTQAVSESEEIEESRPLDGQAYVWLAVSVAFIASVAPLLAVGSSLSSGRSENGGSSIQTAASTNPPQNDPNPAQDENTGGASFVAREPVVAATVVTVFVQLLIIFGFDISSPEQASILTGLTALAGIVIRGQVKPYVK